MTIIDCQVHAYEANTPKRPWHNVPNWPPHVTGDEMVEAMKKVGVDGAIFISAFSLYQYDASYAVEVQRAHPGQFGIVKPVNPDNILAVADVIADWKKTPGAVGIRIMLTKEARARSQRPRPRPHPPCRRPLRHSGQHFVLGQPGRRHGADRSPPRRALHHRPSGHPAAAHAAGPAAALGRPAEGIGTWPERPNAVIKVSGACTLSKEPYPLPDIWDPLARVFAAWGFDRCLWGTDWELAPSQSSPTSRASHLPENGPAERQRAGHVDGRRVRQGLWLVAEARLGAPPRAPAAIRPCRHGSIAWLAPL